MGFSRKWTGMRIKRSARFYVCKKIFNRKLSVLGPGSEKKCDSTHENKPQGERDRVAEKRTPRFPSRESVVPKNAQKQRCWKIVNALLRRWRCDWNCFAQLFLSFSSASTEQSQICVKSAKLAMLEQGILFWAAQCHYLCQQVWWRHIHLWPMILLKKKIYCEGTKNEWKGSHNKIVWYKFVLMQDSWHNGWSRTVHHDNRHWRILTIHWFSGLSWLHFAKRWKNHLTRKVGFEGISRLDPTWKSQTVSYLQGTYGVEIGIESLNKDKSHSRVIIFHGLNKLVIDFSNIKEEDDSKQETFEMQFEDCALKTNVFAFASRSKVKAKPRRRISASSST